MAHPITFRPAPVDPHMELMHRVEAAPKEHAEALLVLWDLLQTAHDKGILDLVQGVVGGKDIIAGKLAEGAALPESVDAIRNLIAVTRVLAAFDPEVLQGLAKNLEDMKAHHTKQVKAGKEDKPLSFWQIGKRALSADGRRGIGFATNLLTAFGRATQASGKH